MESTNRSQLARSTVLVMVAFGLAKVVSLAQTVIIARTLGISAEYDAFVAANRLPEVIFNLIAGGAIAFAFIPVFTGLLAQREDITAWKTASHVVNTVFGLTLAVSIIVFLLAPWLVATQIAPGFSPAAQAQTTEMMRILLVSTIIFSISGMVMGILQSHNRFLLPALAPILFDLGILAGVIFLLPMMGIYGLAVGAVIGAALHLGVQIPGLFRVKARWFPEFGWNDPHFRRIVRLMIPRVADLGLISLSALVSQNLLSRLGEGATSAYDWGWRLMQIPETLIGTAMGVVIFPTLAALSSVGDEDGKRSAMSGALRFIYAATIPSAVFLIVGGRTLISILEGNAFDTAATSLVYSALQAFALGIVVHSMLEVVARSFYADKDTLTPLFAAAGGAILNIGFAALFSGALQRTSALAVLVPPTVHVTSLPIGLFQFPAAPEGVGILALANTLGVAFEVVVLMWILRKRWHSLAENEMARTALKTLAASLAMGLSVAVVGFVWTALGLSGRGTILTLVQAGSEITVGGLVFLGAAYVLKMDEVRTLLTQGYQRLRALPLRGQAKAAT
jgi:putative peptidoglycan lipid II flippase